MNETSTAKNGEGVVVPSTDYASLAQVVARRTPGELQFQPLENDDWGTIRTADGKPFADTGMASQMTDAEIVEARRTGSTPNRVEANGLAIVTAVNHFAGAVERIRELEADSLRMRRCATCDQTGGVGCMGLICDECRCNLESRVAELEAENRRLQGTGLWAK